MTAVASSLARWAYTMGSRLLLGSPARFLTNKRFAFAVAAVAVTAYKLVHIYSHKSAIPPRELQLWGSSFFLQDTLFLALLRVLLEGHALASTVAYFLVGLCATLSFISVTFFASTGSELQWRNLALAGDSSSWSLATQALAAGALVAGGYVVVAAATQNLCYSYVRIAWAIISWPAVAVLDRVGPSRRGAGSGYSRIPTKNMQDSIADDEMMGGGAPERRAQGFAARANNPGTIACALVGISLLLQFSTTLLRPRDNSLMFMSWTLLAAPYADIAMSSKSTLSDLLAASAGFEDGLQNATALAAPINYEWLPKGMPLAGFQDWYEEGGKHYSAAHDPIKLSNLDDALLPEIRDALADISIRNVMLIKLESTRKDVFPLKKDGAIYRALAKSYEDKHLPANIHDFLANVTPTARYLTGDYDDGFDPDTKGGAKHKRRGGISFNDAFTTSSYTLKSLAGTFCGVGPLAVDFNQEYLYPVYQPCLPHIFDAFNNVSEAANEASRGGSSNDFTSMPWRSQFMQSVTLRYDKQDKLMPTLGYTQDNLVDWWSITENPRYGPVNISDINYYGMPEVAIEDYIRNAFKEGKEKGERVFLSHLTSTTHHAFGIPDEEENYVPLTKASDLNDLSHYVNAVGYDDGWLQKILDILDETGVADETLVVLVGDHGLSIAELGTVTPYSNPHVKNFHIPLVLSHPKLPSLQVADAVQSLQIVPTILDLLIETKSLSSSVSKAARDLLRNYEGQSLVRPQRKFSDKNGHGSWQFTVMNPGGSTIAVRDARQPNWRLIVPVMGNYEWRFTDLETDPFEEKPLQSFELKSLVKMLGKENGTDSSRWVEKAAKVTSWWASENIKRWHYDA